MAQPARIAMPIFACGTGNDVYFLRLAAGLNGLGLRTEVLPLPWWFEFLPAVPYRFRRALRSYDLIHTNSDWGTRFHTPGKPLVITIHHCVLNRWYRPYTSVSQRLYYRGLLRRRLRQATELAHTIFCPSRATCDAAIEVFPSVANKIRHVPHGIDLCIFQPSPSCRRKRNTLLSVGAISRRKGAELFPALMDALGADFHLQYIGRGNGSLLRHPRIEWRGTVRSDELVTLYRTCAVYVSLSRLEGFGYTVAEAMSCGTPVVAPAGSSLPELIGDSAPQLFHPDDVSECAERIRAICRDEELRDSLGHENRQRAEQCFSMDRMLGAYVAVYRKALGPAVGVSSAGPLPAFDGAQDRDGSLRTAKPDRLLG
jgi:glycosyltransferase involved in cell wall biosynthesis